MPHVFRGRTPTSRKERRKLRNEVHARRLSKYLHRDIEWLDGTGGGAREWNFSQLRDALALSLEKSGYEAKAKHVRACHRDFNGYRCKSGHTWAIPAYTCHHRLCPFEMKERSLRARKRFSERLKRLHHGKYLVLSERNCGLWDLAEGIASLWDAWGRLTKNFLRPFGARGAVAALELTFNGADKSWHPHLNVVLDCSLYLPFKELNAAWIEATEQRGRSSWIEGVDQGTVYELLKYITKLIDFVDNPETVAAFVGSIRRQRFIRSWGTLYGFESEENEEKHGLCCPDCGACEFSFVGVFARRSVYWDDAGQARFAFDSS